METTASDTAAEREFDVTGLKDLGVPESENSDSVFVSLATREKTGLRFAASRAFDVFRKFQIFWVIWNHLYKIWLWCR